ncbi:MAG: TIGR02147 family protein, partial [Myxococcota bacterium]
GKRHLSTASAARVAKALGLDTGRARHLKHLVAFEQASDFEERAKLLAKMKAAQRFTQVWGEALDVYTFYADWTLPVLREVVSLDDFVEDAESIAERIHARLTPRQAQEGLDRLLALGYLERGSDGRLRPVHKIISTPSELRSDVLKQHQREMMRLASDALDSQERHVRDMRVVTVAISQRQANRIKALLTELQKEVLAIVEEDEPIEVVYQLNTQWFALTEPPPHDATASDLEHHDDDTNHDDDQHKDAP